MIGNSSCANGEHASARGLSVVALPVLQCRGSCARRPSVPGGYRYSEGLFIGRVLPSTPGATVLRALAAAGRTKMLEASKDYLLVADEPCSWLNSQLASSYEYQNKTTPVSIKTQKPLGRLIDEHIILAIKTKRGRLDGQHAPQQAGWDSLDCC